MICADSSSFIAFTKGGSERDCHLVAEALAKNQLVLSPISQTELLSDPKLTRALKETIIQIPTLSITAGYWHRAGKLRALLYRHQDRPKITDTLIAQSCLDHKVPLITRDNDFLPFHKFAGLQLL